MALVGNPNAGKTTLFNSLTGSFQKVGNYPGVTVEKVSANLKLGEVVVECIDVPGLYSLKAVSEDERVALQVIRGDGKGMRKPDLLVCVIDATNLERNLYLYSQIAELGIPTIVALTMTDRLERHGNQIDLPAVKEMIGSDVVLLVGHKDKGIADLKRAIERNLKNPRIPDPKLAPNDPLGISIHGVQERAARLGVDLQPSDIKRALVSPSPDFEESIGGFPELKEALTEAKANLVDQPEVTKRYDWSAAVQSIAIAPIPAAKKRKMLTDRIDKVLTDRVFGFAIFVAIMYVVFLSIYSFATPIMDLIEAGFGQLSKFVSPYLEGIPWLQSLVVDGLINGIGSMLVFLPQILILFFFISVLEGSGYLARAAFLMDRLLGWCGLNGRAFIPLLSSFACAIPGIMAARVMPDKNSRLATILVAPLMSCSARLPVYILLIGAFIEPKYGAGWAAFTLFAMHLLGLVVAIPIVWILNRKVIKGKRLPFLLELPPYQWPKWRDVWLAMYFRGKIFVKTAGTIIFFMTVLIWALSYFPRLGDAREAEIRQAYAQRVASNDPKIATLDAKGQPLSKEELQAAEDKVVDEEQLANSVLGRFGKTIEPVFTPAGFDWRITTSILSAFPARETVVPSLGIIFSLGGDVADSDSGTTDLSKALSNATWPDGRPLFTVWTAVGLMVFFALCAQCMATLATVKRETNSWKWSAFMFTYMTALAYIGAVFVNLLGKLFG